MSEEVFRKPPVGPPILKEIKFTFINNLSRWRTRLL